MWNRASWHECAEELNQVSRRFRNAYLGTHHQSLPKHPDDVGDMRAASVQGVQILRALALAVRSEQDFDLVPSSMEVVGAVKLRAATIDDAGFVKQSRGYEGVLGSLGFAPLRLRQALNKIAHADPTCGDFYVGPGHGSHDLLLFGDDQGNRWFAAISILRLIEAVRSLPDRSIPMTTLANVAIPGP
jgi:hypothetical protein